LNMSKSKPKSTEKYSTIEELALMRMSISAMREQINQSLDGMLDQINRLIPPEDSNRCIKQKNYTKKDWADFLEF